MALTDDPFYRRLIEGVDTQIIVGTMGTRTAEGEQIFPVFIIDYAKASDRAELFVKETFDDLKVLHLQIKDGVYFLKAPDNETILLFHGEEKAVHTAPSFWAEFTPSPNEDEAFREAFAQRGFWLFVVLTPETVRQFVIDSTGEVAFKNAVPLTPELRKVFKMDE